MLDKNFLIGEYIENQRSASEIGRMLGISHTTVTKYLIFYGIHTRSIKESLRIWHANHEDPKIGIKHTPEHKANIGAGLKKAYASGNRVWTDESKEKSRRSNRGQKRSQTAKVCMRQNHANFKGENHPRWRGGISYEPYCHKFTERVKEDVRQSHGRVCYLCGKTEEVNGRKLAVHHIDYNKNTLCNGNGWALLPLCQKCHNKTTNNRWYYFNRLINYWIEKYIDFCN